MDDIDFMQQALLEAEKAGARDEVPIGALIVHEGKIIAGHGNRTRELKDPTAHAEILCIREACQHMDAQRIPECELYVTLEPCAMCAAAIGFARIHKLVIGASDPKGGAVFHGPRLFEQPTSHHRKIELIKDIETQRCADMLQSFFKQKRS
jgi:tRNA(adenine34) deaminase